MDQYDKDSMRTLIHTALGLEQLRDERQFGSGMRRTYSENQAIVHLLTRIEELEAQVTEFESFDKHWQHIIQQQGIMIATILDCWPDHSGNSPLYSPDFLKSAITERLNAIEKPLTRNVDSDLPRPTDPDIQS